MRLENLLSQWMLDAAESGGWHRKFCHLKVAAAFMFPLQMPYL
jgi:hypothetical protein